MDGSTDGAMDEAQPPRSGPALVDALRSGDAHDVRVVPLYGADASCTAVCSLLRIEGLWILLDCGWTEDLDTELLAPLAAVAPHIDLVLLSHADTAHIGALPYAHACLGLPQTAPILATLPCAALGHIALYELLASAAAVRDGALPVTLDDVDAVMERVEGVRFEQQLVQMASARGSASDAGGAPWADVRLTAHAAGHSLGGAVWHVRVQNQDFLYAPAITLKSDSHLRGCALQQRFHRPALLLAGASAAARADPEAEQPLTFCREIVNSLRRRGGHVLVPVDVTGRVLELLLVLERHWAANNLTYPLVFLCQTGASVLAKARAQLEFMSEAVQTKFTRGRGGHPFDLPHVHAVSHPEALHALPQRANLVVLAPLDSLDLGLARDLFLHYGWAEDAKNAVILPFAAPGGGGGAAGSLTAALARHAATAAHATAPLRLELDVAFRVPLSQAELAARREAEEARIQEQGTSPLDADWSGGGPDSTSSSSSGAMDVDVAEGGDGGTAADTAMSAGVEEGVPVGEGGDADGSSPVGPWAHVLIDGFTVPADAVAPMFPPPPPQRPRDEFGEIADLAALCGRAWAAEEGGSGSDEDDGAGGVDGIGAPTAALEAPSHLGLDTTKVVHERRVFTIRARIYLFDFSSLISQSSFLSMIRAVAPRNLVLLQRSTDAHVATQFRALVDDVLTGLHSHVHTPVDTAAVTLSSTACYVAALDARLAAAVASARAVIRPPYRLSWLDAVVTGTEEHTGRPVLGVPGDGGESADEHSAAGVFVGDMLASDVTQQLKKRRVPVEQEGSAVVVDEGTVVVRAIDGDQRSHLVIEGALSARYYEVRDAVYGLYCLAGAQEK